LASKTVDATTLETSAGSSSEPNSPVSIKPAESKKSIVEPLDEIMENIGFKESSDQSFSSSGSEEQSDSIINYSEEDSTARYGGVSDGSEDEWMSGLELYNSEPTIFSSNPNQNINNHHQVYVGLEQTSEEFDAATTLSATR
jgi:hypothetical protein